MRMPYEPLHEAFDRDLTKLYDLLFNFNHLEGWRSGSVSFVQAFVTKAENL